MNLSYEEKTKWFHKARFGLFVHWGLYSMLGRGEWVMFRERIPQDEYCRLANSFTGNMFDANIVADLACAAGMKYGILTARHHDGFCLWDSKCSDFTSMKTIARRDFVLEFVNALRARGLKVGIYLSNIDWRYKGYFEPELYPESQVDLVNQLHAQTEELLTNYGKIDLLWFDGGWIDHGRKKIDSQQFWRSHALLERIYKLQPEILVNNRLGIPADLDTPEQVITSSSRGRCWESCMTIGDSQAWGYVKNNPNRKTLATLLQSLSTAASQEGNFLLNISPQGNGAIDSADTGILRQIGDWLCKNGESIYNSCRFSDEETSHFQGVWTRVENIAYLHVFRWSHPDIVLPLISHAPIRAKILCSEQELTIRTASNRRIILGNLPEQPPHSCQCVIKLEFEHCPELIQENNHAAWLDGMI